MPEDLKLPQIGSSQLPTPFRGLHSPGVRKHCQIIFACYFRKSSIVRSVQYHLSEVTFQYKGRRRSIQLWKAIPLVGDCVLYRPISVELTALRITSLSFCSCFHSRHLLSRPVCSSLLTVFDSVCSSLFTVSDSVCSSLLTVSDSVPIFPANALRFFCSLWLLVVFDP